MDGGGFEDWEGVARAVHDATGATSPVSAFELARACGLELVPHLGGAAYLDRGRVHFDGRARLVRQHGQVAHEVAHYVLRLHAVLDTEQAARYTSGALMLPRADFSRQLQDTAWDVRQLQARNPNVSAEMIARRICELRDACVAIVDNGKLRVRVVSPWLPPGYSRLSKLERDLADACLATGEVQRVDALSAAFPMFDGTYRRVLVVCEARQLSLRRFLE